MSSRGICFSPSRRNLMYSVMIYVCRRGCSRRCSRPSSKRKLIVFRAALHHNSFIVRSSSSTALCDARWCNVAFSHSSVDGRNFGSNVLSSTVLGSFLLRPRRLGWTIYALIKKNNEKTKLFTLRLVSRVSEPWSRREQRHEPKIRSQTFPPIGSVSHNKVQEFNCLYYSSPG